MYCALIGDLVKSRELSNRYEVQEKLDEIIDEVNDEFRDVIVSPMTLTIGDEVQVLLESSEYILEITETIKERLYPIEIRFGIGIGNVSTRLRKDLAIGTDGEVYHRARNALLELSSKKNKKIGITNGIRIGITKTEIDKLIEILNSNLDLLMYIQNKWSLKQHEVISLYSNKNLSQNEIADMLDINQSAVVRRLKSSGYYIYTSGKKAAKKALNEVWEAMN